MSDSTSATSAEFNIYVNGQSVWSGPGFLPVLTQRPNAYLGKSGWSSDENFYGFIDSYFMYNYPISAEAATIHAALPIPPSFELTFTRTPAVTGSTFGWAADDGTEVHQGLLTLSGTQFANLSATSGANFVGFTIQSLQGNNRDTPGVASMLQNGWSFHIVFRATNVNAGATIVEFADSTGSNALKLAFAAEGLLFTHAGQSINCGSVGTGSWTDVLITIVQDRATFEGQCYISGVRSVSRPSFPAIPYTMRNSVLLGRSNTGTNTFFTGDIDGFRVMPYAVTSEDAWQLYTASSRSDRFFVPPAYTSGPVLSYTFDEDDAPLPSTDPVGSASYNFYNWDRVGPAYAVNASHTGVVIFNGTGNSNALRQYVDATFDQDAYGNTLPQVFGGSMSFETWICMGAPMRAGQAIFDFGDNPSNAWNGGQGAGQFNILLGQALTGANETAVFESFHLPSQSASVTATIFTPGSWQHIAATIRAGANNQSTATIYVDGVQRASGTITTPPARFRRSAFIGRSNWDRPALFATMDSFYMYNYALDVSQIQLHMAIPYPPAFDASFDTNPLFNTEGTNYGWLAVDPAAPNHRGVLTFNSDQFQFVDLNLGTGPLSIGQYFPMLNGPSVGAADQGGFTIEISLKWTVLTARRPVLDLANGNGVDSFSIGTDGNLVKLYTQNGLTDEKANITLFTATANTWYHVVITAARIASANDTMTYTTYVNGTRASSANAWAPIPLIRRTSYIARSTENIPGAPTLFTGSLDLLRYYTYVTSPAIVSTLYQLNQVVVIPPAVSSSSTGGARSSSSSSSSAIIAPTSAVVPSMCGGAGYNFNSIIGRLMTFQAGNWNYAFSPCATINQPGLCTGMVCQNTTLLSGYNPDRQFTSWYAVNNGVIMQQSSGAVCGGTPRTATIVFTCNAAAIDPFISAVSEPATCRYEFVVQTSLACNPTGATGGTQVGDDWYDPRCGGGAYDLSSLSSIDIDAPFGAYNWSIAICNYVRNPICAPRQPVSICQIQNANTFKLADYSALPTLWSLNEDGMNLTSITGQDCGGLRNRTTTVKLICSATATTPRLDLVQETSTCVYLFLIRTNAVCGAPFRLPSSSSSTAVVPTSALRSSSSSSSSAVASSAVVPRSSSSSSIVATSAPVTPSTATPRSSSSSSAVAQPSSSVVPIGSSTGGTGTWPENSVRVIMNVILPQAVDATNFATIKDQLERDIVQNIADLTGVSSTLLNGQVSVQSIGRLTSGARRLLQTETSVVFIIFGTISQILTNLGVDAAQVARTVANSLSTRINDNQFRAPNSGVTVPSQTLVISNANDPVGEIPDNGINGSVSTSINMLVLIAAALFAVIAA